ncbi:hypothetical protein ABMA58_05075, partial [Oceanospirillum sp. HFRX-1_2]
TIAIGLWLFGAELWFASLLVTVVMGLIIGRYRQQNTQPKLQHHADNKLGTDNESEITISRQSGRSPSVAHPAQS